MEVFLLARNIFQAYKIFSFHCTNKKPKEEVIAMIESSQTSLCPWALKDKGNSCPTQQWGGWKNITVASITYPDLQSTNITFQNCKSKYW